LTNIHIANAPCSWGALEFEGLEGRGGEEIAYGQMLDELCETGYTGTELGDWGYMPTEPIALGAELEKRNLAMVGAFVPVALKYPELHAEGGADALKVARLLASVVDSVGNSQLPFLILADANGTDHADGHRDATIRSDDHVANIVQLGGFPRPDLADRLGGQGEVLRGPRRAHPAGKLPKRKRAQDDAHLLNAPSQ